MHGIKDHSLSHASFALAPLDAKASTSGAKAEDGQRSDVDDATKQIQECCTEWRAGSVVPRWFYFSLGNGNKAIESKS